MSRSARTHEPTWPLRVKTVAAELTPIEICNKTTVRQLKRIISEQDGFLEPSQRHSKRLRLMHTHKKKIVELNDDSNTLESYGVCEGVELSLIVDDLPSTTKGATMRLFNDPRNLSKIIAEYLFAHSGELDLTALNYNAVSMNTMLRTVSESISRITSITSLNLKGNHEGREQVDEHTAEFSDVLCFESVKLLAAALQSNQSITDIDLSNNFIGNDGVNSISTMCLLNKTITSLNLSNNLEIELEHTARFVRNVRKSGRITKLGMLRFEVDYEVVSNLLAPGVVLEALEIDFDVTCLQTCQLFADNVSITDLRLDPITDLNVNSFGFFNMCANKKIRKFSIINCSNPQFFDYGANLISTAFKRHMSINTLILQSNSITMSVVPHIVNMLSENNSITVLDLFGNDLADDGASEISKCLANNSVLRVLNLGLNDIGISGATAIATMLISNSTLVEVGLADNMIDDDGVSLICEALQRNCRIEEIDLTNNEVTEASYMMQQDEERILLTLAS